MSEMITLDLPEPLVDSARAVALQTNRRIEDVLIEWLDRAATEVPVELLSDEQVLTCAIFSSIATSKRSSAICSHVRLRAH